MDISTQRAFPTEDFDLSFKVFHELMAKKVTEILLVSSPYDAFIMEEEGRLVERIIHEYRGLNLSRPPMLTWVSSAHEAMDALSQKKFEGLKADPSQGSHFFHNITSLGISYLNTAEGGEDFIDWKWLRSLPAKKEISDRLFQDFISLLHHSITPALQVRISLTKPI